MGLLGLGECDVDFLHLPVSLQRSPGSAEYNPLPGRLCAGGEAECGALHVYWCKFQCIYFESSLGMALGTSHP